MTAPLPLESTVQAAIIGALESIGCTVFVHHATSRGKRESAAPGFGKGFPDLMVLDAGTVIFAEVKRGPNEVPRPDQIVTLNRLTFAGAIVFVWSDAARALRDVMAVRKGKAA